MQMPPHALITCLDPLGLADWRFYPVATSTNDLALTWAEEGAADFSLILADAQTAGRGRGDHQWVTKPGAALAFSLILRPGQEEICHLPRFTALAALSLLEVMDGYGLQGRIKWPNDVLLNGRKAAGILVESDWQEGRPPSLVIGMGVNVASDSTPPAELLRYPATSIETEVGRKIDRWEVLASILHAYKDYRGLLTTPEFIQLWNDRLAFWGEKIRFRFPDGEVCSGKVIEIQSDGRLALRTDQGEIVHVLAGEIEQISCDSRNESKTD